MGIVHVLRTASSRIVTDTTVPPSHHSTALVVDRFLELLRGNALFAVSEISKAVVIVGFGDFATADAVGEFVTSLAPSAARMSDALSFRHKVHPERILTAISR